MIVVGIDGSDGARRALDFAVEEALMRDSDLRIVSAWHIPTQLFSSGAVAGQLDMEAFEASMRAAAESQVAAAVAGREGLRYELAMREGQPSVVLVEESERAELLVVGSRGHGGFSSLLLGSVSQQCAAHALCPVAIVPAHARPRPVG
jgi:nucleotide-binding universal stress UspA family protein